MTRSVLVVDDHPSPATSAAHALEAAGYIARVATSVDAAFAELVRGVPDVVVLDHALDRDGAMLRATLVHHRARVLYVSGFDAEGDAPGVAASHAWPFLPKPFDTAALTYDGTTLRLYQDGVQVATASYSGVIDYGADPTATAWCVGGNNLVTAEQMAGELADVRIYNVTQSASWVARVYKRGRRSYKP